MTALHRTGYRPRGPPAPRARAGRRREPRPAPRRGEGVAPARLRAVEPRPRLRVPRRRGLAAAGLAAGPGGADGDDREPADRGQPAELPPRDRDPVRPRRRLGRVGRTLDGRGGPARHRAARLPRRHPRRRPGRAGTAADDAHAGGLRLRRQDGAPGGRLRELPGTRDPRLAPQHRRGDRLPARRAAADPHLDRREPAHGLLPQPGGGGARPRPGRDDGGDPRRGGRVPDARARACRTSSATR